MAEQLSSAAQPVPQKGPEGVPGIVKLAPLLAVPLALPALAGVLFSGAAVAVAVGAIGPKGRELLKSSGKALGEMLPVAKSAFLAATKENEQPSGVDPLSIK
ncbi:MAG: hypothetical protein WCH05_04490 [Chlorobiaceae bacterium]